MKRLWEELSTLHVKTQCSCNCIYGATKSMFKVKQDRRLMQFLMGLNEVYTVVRGNILMMNPLPSLAQTFSLLVHDEKQREIKPSRQSFMESASLNARSSGKKVMESVAFNSSAGASTSRSSRPNYSSAENSKFRTNYSQPSSYIGNKPCMICDYCKRPGHTKDKCYKLHGFNKGEGLVFDVHGNAMSPEDEEHRGTHNDIDPQLTREQYAQFLELLQQLQVQKHGDTDNPMDFPNVSVNFAGASNHMTSDKTLLTNITYLPFPLLITLPNGYRVKVVQTGSLAPSLKRPLVISEAKAGLYFLLTKCLMKPNHPDAKCVASTASASKNMSSPMVSTSYTPSVKAVPFPASLVQHCASFNKKSQNYDSFMTHSCNDVNVLWHNRLGHVPFVKMREIKSIPEKFSTKQPFLCTICTMNMTNAPSANAPNQLENSNISLNATFSKHQHIPPEVLADESQTLVRNISNDDELSLHGEATMNPTWQQAMTHEFEALHANHTCDLVDLPSGKKAI
ncbi:uncharacterized protein LOC125856060 [Solanum stenotomum]|uniref:uncharacterized protein LOC125856060 n=1 Tax=Solanum stenotomum TaxID=172797 RepID=UPI0020D16E9E|nr:uncharacterized protein LOC125856060 [Solanum stenotomum]